MDKTKRAELEALKAQAEAEKRAQAESTHFDKKKASTTSKVSAKSNPKSQVSAPNPEESEIKKSPLELVEEIIEEDTPDEVTNQIGAEKLPGMVKTKWALNFKMDTDRAIEEALNYKITVREK